MGDKKTEDRQTEEKRTDGYRAVYDMGGLKTVFWGLLFTVINIRIQGFDILPDVIGYLIVIAGLRKIEAYEGKFTAAKRMARVLTAVSLINIYQEPAGNAENPGGLMGAASNTVNFSAGIFGDVPWLAVFLMVVGLLANFFFIYFMCMGMKSLLLQIGDFALAGICDDRWKLILAAGAGLSFSVLTVYLGAGAVGMMLALVFGVLALIALILFLLLVYRAYKSLEEKESI